MSAEYFQKPPDEIDLRNYTYSWNLRRDCDKFDSPRDYIDIQRKNFGYEDFMTDVVYRAADILEPRSGGAIMDEQKRGANAFIDGALIAASLIEIAGGQSVLDKLEFNFKAPSRHDIAEETWLRRRTHIWKTGMHWYEHSDQAFEIYRHIIAEWEQDLSEPDFASYVRAGFGFVMHLASETINRERPVGDIRAVLEESLISEDAWDEALRRISLQQDR